jgi:uncharacterized membrane protein YgcG
MANVEVSRLLAEIAANGDPDIEASRLLAEVAASGDPDAEVSRLAVEVIAEYIPDEALLNSTLVNAGNSLSGTLANSGSAGVHELYLCVLSNLGLNPPPEPGENGGISGEGGESGGVAGGGSSGYPPVPVDPPPDLSDLAQVVHEQYIMVLSALRTDTRKPKFFTYLIPDD